MDLQTLGKKSKQESQGSPVSPILFLIYISEVFSAIDTKLPNVKCVSFVDDLAFLISNCSINKIAKVLEKAGKIALQWGTSNSVTYDISKTEAILFSNARRLKLARQIAETRLKIDGEVVFFNKETSR